ncbi:hypothetical protein CIW49_20555 [Mycolicibacterium sp. P1-18]|nr:hypothetical protein CIW49_20555 [Mycolicibacterium sp. P1-18]
MPLGSVPIGGNGGNMLYKRTSRLQKIRRTRTFGLLADVLAGVHAANGLAHGVQPPADSRTRYANTPE